MLAKVFSASPLGTQASLVEVEVDLALGLPRVILIGLPDAALRESRDRILAAIRQCRFPYEPRKLIINLAPADLRKEGPMFDLPIAVGILMAHGLVGQERVSEFVMMGELAMDGALRPIRGVLPIALSLARLGKKKLLVPDFNSNEASVVDGIECYPVRNLIETIAFLKGEFSILPSRSNGELHETERSREDLDFADVRGQFQAKRALEIAAAGRHNILLVGPPGSGKTMLAQRFISILPRLSRMESLETSAIYSISALLSPERPLIRERPLRSPHHSASAVALCGGGNIPRPGEISLAHHGVLFLDELAEFDRHALESLRQPLEEGEILIARSQRSLRFPCQFQLLAAMNPCPCGWRGNPQRECRCTPRQIWRYHNKLSGPLLDRIDLQVEVPQVPFKDLTSSPEGESSSEIRRRVERAQKRQLERFLGTTIRWNCQMSHRQIRQHCAIDDAGLDLLKKAMEALGLSARAHDKILKIARTIADLAGSDAIQVDHLAEAIQYRCLDRNATPW